MQLQSLGSILFFLGAVAIVCAAGTGDYGRAAKEFAETNRVVGPALPFTILGFILVGVGMMLQYIAKHPQLLN